MVVANSQDISLAKVEQKKKDPSKYLSFQPLPSDKEIAIIAKYHLSSVQITKAGIKWSNTIDRYILPINGRDGLSMGFVARTENPQVKPKALTYITKPEQPLGAYYLNKDGGKKLWLVEDQYSALRISEKQNAVALLGTNLTTSLLTDIKAGLFEEIVVCLDADAAEQGVALCTKLQGLFNKVHLKIPKQDVKNMTYFDLKKFLADE